MLLHLIRHTPVALPPGICYGFSDVLLADERETDILSVTQSLKCSTDAVVYSSPLLRCKLLAQAISTNIIFDNRLKELNFGDWELQPWDQMQSPEAEAWMNDYINIRCPGGESFLDLCERAKSFLAYLKATEQTEATIVTHAGVIRAMLVIMQNISPEQSFARHIEYGEIIAVDF